MPRDKILQVNFPNWLTFKNVYYDINENFLFFSSQFYTDFYILDLDTFNFIKVKHNIHLEENQVIYGAFLTGIFDKYTVAYWKAKIEKK